MTRKKRIANLCVISMLALPLFLANLFVLPTFAEGTHGANLDSASYTSSNPFYPSYRGQCTWYAWGRALEVCNIKLPCIGPAEKWDNTCCREVGTVPKAYSIAVWETSSSNTSTGHVAFVEYVTDTEIGISECNWGEHNYSEGVFNRSTRKYKCTYNQGNNNNGVSANRTFPDHYIYLTDAEVRGEEMPSGYVRLLPDGDYMIAATGNPSYYLDIDGSASPAANGTNVQIYKTTTGDIPSNDVWTITYSDGFYKIAQLGKDVTLDVPSSDTLNGKNVHVWQSIPSSSGQKWAVSKNGNNGYRLEAKCSGYSLDIVDGRLANNTNVQVWTDNSANAQSWLFIPYRPAQPISDGRYILLYTPDQSYELDVAGDTGNVADGTNVQLWSSTAPSRYNSFDFTKLNNGYYRVTHAASGKCLTVTGGSTAYKANVEISSDNGSYTQQWAIDKNGSGYSLISRVNGYALDLPAGITGDKKNIEVYPRVDNDNQRWTFVQAEHTVQFDANGGTAAPESEIKYFNNELILPQTVPERPGYHFLGWSALSDSSGPSYLPGDVYTEDQDLTLYAVWEALDYTLNFDMNGGEGSLDSIKIEDGAVCTIPDFIPERAGYDFLGWGTDINADTATFQPGDIYPGGDATLYAIWKIRTYVVSFDSAGAGNYDSVTVEHGMTASLPVPKKQGFIFKGWYTSEGALVTDSTEIVSNLALTVRWSEPTRMTLPENLNAIEEEAFAGTAPNVVIIPNGVTSIGSRAFADNQELYSMVVYSRSLTIADDSFANCPNMTVYGYQDSEVNTYCSARGIPFRALDDTSYISSDDLPVGAAVTEEKWSYTINTTETTTSPETSLEGWTRTGDYQWEKTGDGTYQYASIPGGFDTANSLYTKYNKPKLSSIETETTKRDVSNPSFLKYIYWHWTFVDSVNADHASGGHNVYIRAARMLNENVSGSVYRDFIYFDAFETTENQGTVGPRSATDTYDIGTEGGYYFWRNNNADASQWWWRFNVFQQTYTDYRKIFTYTKNVSEDKESLSPVADGDGISNVVHQVKYSF